ncbi:MAG: hypothetical protein ABR582_15825 [Gemmatimonadaceae bacterium]
MTFTRPFLCIAIVVAAACSNSTAPDLRTGIWGGPRVGLSVEDTRVFFLFDCAGGEVNNKIPFSTDGRFDVTGTFSGGGNAIGADHSAHPARYFGRLVGTHITFTRLLLDGSLPDASFAADFGTAPSIVAC